MRKCHWKLNRTYYSTVSSRYDRYLFECDACYMPHRKSIAISTFWGVQR